MKEPTTELAAAEVFREASETIPVGQPPVDEVVAWAQGRRRRHRQWVAGAAVGLLVAVGVGTWLGTRPSGPELPEAVVTPAENPAGIAWYANGVLHLARVAVELPQVVEMVEVPDGVVYVDKDERVILVDGEGKLKLLGTSSPESGVAGSGERGWVAWVEPGDPRPELIVYDTFTRRPLDRRPLGPGGTQRVVAVDQDRVYFQDGDGTWAWQVRGPELERLGPSELVDVSSAVRAVRLPSGKIQIAQPLFDITQTVVGGRAVLSPDGDYLLTRVDDRLPEEVRIYEAASGNSVPTGLIPEEVAVAAGFGPGNTVTYLVAFRENAPDGDQYVRLSSLGPHLLRTCDLDTLACENLTQLGHSRGQPVLPH